MNMNLFEYEPYQKPTASGRADEFLFTDGGCINSSRSSEGITWAWALVGAAPVNIPVQPTEGGLASDGWLIKSDSGLIRCEDGLTLTNNMAEYIAMLRGLEAMVEGWEGAVVSDSEITIGRFFWGWRNKGIDQELIERKNAALKRISKITWIHVDGHPTKKQLLTGKGKRGNIVSKWNMHCDSLCNLAKQI